MKNYSSKGGRPQEITEAVQNKIIEMSKEGFSQRYIAEVIGFHNSSVALWQKKLRHLIVEDE